MVQVSRRFVVGGCGSLLVAAGTERTGYATQAAKPPRDMLPQPGDLLIEAYTDKPGAPLKPSSVKLGADDPLLAWGFDPTNKTARDGSRLNLLLLMRFDPKSLGEHERKYSADGVVAYSATCTHKQCTVTDWIKARQVLQCPCHQSQYDPRHGAKVVGGPAPRSLPALPLKIAAGCLVVAAPFTDRVGGER